MQLYPTERTGWLHKVEKNVDSVVPESRVTLDSALLCQDVIVLTLEVAGDLAEGSFVINAVTEARCVHDGQRDPCALLVQFKLDSHWLDLDALFEMRSGRVIGVERSQNLATAEGVDKSCATSS